jgi:hypothetical protein
VAVKFKGNPDIAFGDVCLSRNQVRKIHGVDQNPGAGGWPTVRIFTKDTGYGGKAYEKKTSQAMCDELGPKTDYMQQLVEEYATLCSIDDTSSGCSDKEKDFIAKWADKPLDEVKKQFTRLDGMSGGSMKPEAKKWLKQRMAVFKQVAKKKHGEEL